jgi:HD-like signal output (HDOD) protein
MKSILFVDDDIKILNGLKRMLFAFDNAWTSEFASNAEEALRMLSERRFDLIVADMRMPGMNGVELLTEVAQRHPHMVRVILSGTWDQDLCMQAAMTAHQYLSKPCDPEVLKSTLERAFALRDVLMEPSLKELISRTASLPSAPAIYHQLIDALRNPEVSAQQLGAIIATDIGMTAKVLQLVNSAFFGLRRHITSPQDAVFFLGSDAIKALAISVSAFSMFNASKSSRRFSIDALQEHSLGVAALAREIGKSQEIPKLMLDDAFVAGLLHDVGKLVLVSSHPEKYAGVLDAVAHKGSAAAAEREIFGATHAEVGGYLLWLWGLPASVVEAVVFHHSPGSCPAGGFSPLAAVHVADALWDAAMYGAAAAGPATNPAVDVDYLTKIGKLDQLPEWRSLSAELLSEGAR